MQKVIPFNNNMAMKENHQNELNRREFLKRLGVTSASAALLMGLGPLTSFGRDEERLVIKCRSWAMA